jgi:hypothetical protein
MPPLFEPSCTVSQPLDCDQRSLPPPPLPIRLRRAGRRLLKWRPARRWWSLWDLATTLSARLGLRLETIQVLCVDPTGPQVLLLRNLEYPSGWTAVQGLRDWTGLLPGRRGYGADPRVDARRELAEEALISPPPLSDFEPATRYDEGIGSQFDCRVYLVRCDRHALSLRGHTSEGYPCWMRIDAAVERLGNPVLTDILTRSTTP